LNFSEAYSDKPFYIDGCKDKNIFRKKTIKRKLKHTFYVLNNTNRLFVECE